ncbi:VWA domain-containing protein [Patescibacteria group bacterium]|nr:VWA domain-containing protein [Patescibacteria group bacterium]
MPIIKFEIDSPMFPKATKAIEEAKNADFLETQSPSACIGFILDESSSMAVVWQDTISGFNHYISQLREEIPEAKLTFATFVAGKVKVRGEDTPIDEVLPLNSKSYTPCGDTPLIDSVMRIITLIEQKVLTSPKLKPIIVVQTDGEENSSTNYTMPFLQSVIGKKRKEGWKFLLITCSFNPNVLAQNMGIDPDASIEYGRGKTKQAFKILARTTTMSVKTGEEVAFSLEDKRNLK